tara:strand:+ start:130 stop:1074 length:945 start_codon:yes stop_codon:yes gene_type:complete
MKQIIKCGLLSIVFIFSPFVFSQDSDTTSTEENNRESYTSVEASYSRDKGNTELDSKYFGISYTLIGNAGPLTDTEFLIDYNRSDDQLDDYPFTDDQSLTLKFDVWANQRISPFLFFQKSYDNIIGLEDRMNYGLGAKVGLFKGFSISYAFLFEREDYLLFDFTDSTATGNYYYTDSLAVDTNDYYYDVGWGDMFYVYTDSSEYYMYTDSTNSPAEEFFRHSIRPKLKLKLFDDNVVFDYRFYYKPRVDDFKDYLLEHELKISIATFYEALSIDLNYTDKYNSRYDGVSIINRQTGLAYKDRDTNLSIGFSLAL